MRATLLAMGIVVTVGMSAPFARADGDADRDRAVLYKQGVDLAAAGRWSDAVDRFRRVVQLRASPKALYTLAEAQEHTGQLVEAKAGYGASLTSARASGAKDVVDVATAALARIEPRLPHISVRVDDRAALAHASDARASIDGKSVALGTPVDVDPGAHEVRVEASNVDPFVRTVQLAEGQSEDVVVGAIATAPPAAPPAPSGTPPSSEAPHSSPLVPILVGVGGVALGVTGLVVRFQGQGDYDAAFGKCPASACPDGTIAGAGNDARSRMIVGTVLAGVGAAVTLAAGVYWWLSSRSGPAVQAGVGMDTSGARAMVGGTF